MKSGTHVTDVLTRGQQGAINSRGLLHSRKAHERKKEARYRVGKGERKLKEAARQRGRQDGSTKGNEGTSVVRLMNSNI